MNKEIKLFGSKELNVEIRILQVDGKEMFVASDIAKALGYKRPNDAINAHCRGTVKHRITDSSNRTQEMGIIPEGDVYRLQE